MCVYNYTQMHAFAGSSQTKVFRPGANSVQWEKKMKALCKKSLAVMATLVTAAWVSAPPAAIAQEVTLRLHQFLSAQSNVPRYAIDPWIEKIEQQSDGRIRIEHFASMSLGGTVPQLMDQVKDGTVDIVWGVPGSTPGRFPTTELFELPFMMTDAESTSRAFWDVFEDHMRDTEFKDWHVLATWVHGPGIIHSSKPVKTMDDLRGVSVRAPTRIVNALLNELGATPVGLPIPEVPQALSLGVIGGTVLPWESSASLRVPELVRNHTEFGGGKALYTTSMVLAMNKDRYESLPDDLKKIIDENSGQDLSAEFGRVQQHYDAPGREMAVNAGNNIITLSAEEADQWVAAAEPVVDNWIKEMDALGLDGRGLVDQAHELIERYTQD
ncbi:TRAP-type C4-dicarboxylate transport system, substrate-binding protein [Roseovarius pacificus]|uniref:TRAP-type C4-dicarboxylate transport system, substrate-binding protein n=2 Tax=Roseovarius pacificus TaxID=337701 RepID=A0A1M7BDH4_9RHOB|nr:TRAP-type C4-dicarboxylate transport system, substrate-binding protein [Roseovarius pacificus]